MQARFDFINREKNATSVRVELTILRLTVSRLSQLGHEVIFLGDKIDSNMSCFVAILDINLKPLQTQFATKTKAKTYISCLFEIDLNTSSWWDLELLSYDDASCECYENIRRPPHEMRLSGFGGGGADAARLI